MLSFKQAWEAVVTGKVSAQNGGVAVDTTEMQQQEEKKEGLAKSSLQMPTSDSFGISSSNPNPDLLPDENTITDDERVFAALSYFPFISFFVIATRKDSLFILYHAWQGFVNFVFFVVSLPIYWLFGFIPGSGLLFWLFYVLLFGSGFYAAFMAYSGKYITIPLISSFAQRLSGTIKNS